MEKKDGSEKSVEISARGRFINDEICELEIVTPWPTTAFQCQIGNDGILSGVTDTVGVIRLGVLESQRGQVVQTSLGSQQRLFCFALEESILNGYEHFFTLRTMIDDSILMPSRVEETTSVKIRRDETMFDEQEDFAPDDEAREMMRGINPGLLNRIRFKSPSMHEADSEPNEGEVVVSESHVSLPTEEVEAFKMPGKTKRLIVLMCIFGISAFYWIVSPQGLTALVAAFSAADQDDFVGPPSEAMEASRSLRVVETKVERKPLKEKPQQTSLSSQNFQELGKAFASVEESLKQLNTPPLLKESKKARVYAAGAVSEFRRQLDQRILDTTTRRQKLEARVTRLESRKSEIMDLLDLHTNGDVTPDIPGQEKQTKKELPRPEVLLEELHPLNARLKATREHLAETRVEMDFLNHLQGGVVDLDSRVSKMGLLEASGEANLETYQSLVKDINAAVAPWSKVLGKEGQELFEKRLAAQRKLIETAAQKREEELQARIRDLEKENADLKKRPQGMPGEIDIEELAELVAARVLNKSTTGVVVKMKFEEKVGTEPKSNFNCGFDDPRGLVENTPVYSEKKNQAGLIYLKCSDDRRYLGDELYVIQAMEFSIWDKSKLEETN